MSLCFLPTSPHPDDTEAQLTEDHQETHRTTKTIILPRCPKCVLWRNVPHFTEEYWGSPECTKQNQQPTGKVQVTSEGQSNMRAECQGTKISTSPSAG